MWDSVSVAIVKPIYFLLLLAVKSKYIVAARRNSLFAIFLKVPYSSKGQVSKTNSQITVQKNHAIIKFLENCSSIRSSCKLVAQYEHWKT